MNAGLKFTGFVLLRVHLLMLDHYHLEEGPGEVPEDFTHVRLRSLFFAFAVPF